MRAPSPGYRRISVTCTCCGLSGESSSLITVDCGALVSDLRRRLESDDNLDFIVADLQYGVEAELEEFARRLLILLINTIEETLMSDTRNNGLSTSPQQAITPS
jgi:hypothetical protein